MKKLQFVHWPALLAVLTFLFAVTGCRYKALEQVGPIAGSRGEHLTATYQRLRPAGQTLELNGRPVDLALSRDGDTLYVKDNGGIAVVDTGSWSIRQHFKFPSGGSSWHGLVLTRDNTRLFATAAREILWEAKIDRDGKLSPGRKIMLPGPGGSGNAAPCGLVLSADETTLYVCLSRNNSLGVVDLASGEVQREIPVGVAPYDVVLTPDGKRAFVSNWGGRRAREGDLTAKSSGTDAVVDERGVASSGTVSLIDLESGREEKQVEVGLHPCDLLLAHGGKTLLVANANSDNVAVLDAATLEILESIPVRPDPTLAFGSAPNALALSEDGSRLFVANGGNNAVAVVALAAPPNGKSVVEGFIPTAWFPGGLLCNESNLFIANVKGVGSRNPNPQRKGWNSHYHLGSVGKVSIPDAVVLRDYTRQVIADGRVPQMLQAWEKSQRTRKPLPVPARLGEASVFNHIVYIIKENRTYDQLFGDLSQGNGDPELCVFGREVTPNHHALAERYVLLDNYYCNGVLSADGHAWTVEGYATDYLEKSFGGWARSYPFSGDDPLSFAPSGFIWDHVLMHGLAFRNYGEMSATQTVPQNASFFEILEDYQQGAGKIRFKHTIAIDRLRQYSCPDSPGWQMRIPDMIRADVFLREFEQFERRGDFPNLVIIFLPSDHTSGTAPGKPTPRAQVADNDLALGRIVERISKSRFWPKTCIFAMEDDPQNGWDHVDGHRSICLVASPYTKRGEVVSNFYNQSSVLHTMCRMLGIAPLNQMVAAAPLMSDCFTTRPDFSAYECLPNRIPLDEMNKPVAALKGDALRWALKSMELPLEEVDAAEEDLFNRILWHSVKGTDAPYPAHLAGAHGKGLEKLGLRFDRQE